MLRETLRHVVCPEDSSADMYAGPSDTSECKELVFRKGTRVQIEIDVETELIKISAENETRYLPLGFVAMEIAREAMPSPNKVLKVQGMIGNGFPDWLKRILEEMVGDPL